MREIKFRAWNIEDKKYSDWPAHVGSLVSDVGEGIFDSNFIIEQFTGLKDKNGVEIYEGDIVKSEGVMNPGLVSWDDDEAHFEFTEGNALNDFNAVYPEAEWEVIGNIHQHPELLEGE